MRCFLPRTRWILLLCGLLVVMPPAQASDKVMLNFVNADIEYVLQAIGKITGKNFVIDPRVKGSINIVSYRPVSREMAFRLLLSALRLQGFAAVEADGVTKIVPEADAKQNTGQTFSKPLRTAGDRVVTQVYPLQFESAQSMVNILRPLITPNNTISASPTTNTLVITDYADNIRRLNKIIESMDQPGNNELSIIKLKNASALDLAQIVGKLMGDGGAPVAGAGAAGAGTARFTVMADTRTNSLLVWTDRVARLDRVKSLVASLDVPTTAAGNIHVVHLRNADATQLAQTLRGILSQSAQTNTIQAPAAKASNTPTFSAKPTAHGAATASTANAATSQAATAEGGGIITADAATNSLIITAPDNVYNSLRTVIDKLDARRAQVLVEALIAEVTSDKVSQLGIQWQGLGNLHSGNGAYGAGTNFGGQGNILGIQDPSNLGPGLNVGIVKKGLALGSAGTPIMNMAMLANALATDANTNILSTPNIVTLDNEEASILVGENVPFVTGSYSTAAGAATSGATVNPFQTVDRQDVGLTLKVKPQVLGDGMVRLKIYQEVSDIKDTSNPAGIITDKRSIDSTVQVQDGQIIVLGGLMKDQVGQNVNRVPGLSSIPLLGHLFRNDSRSRSKTDLMVFLRPYIMRTPTSSDSYTLDRYDYIRNAEEHGQLPHSFLMPNYPGPQLPRPIILPAPSGAEPVKPAESAGEQADGEAAEPQKAAVPGRPITY
jgi:general secretion pathway protein D